LHEDQDRCCGRRILDFLLFYAAAALFAAAPHDFGSAPLENDLEWAILEALDADQLQMRRTFVAAVTFLGQKCSRSERNVISCSQLTIDQIHKIHQNHLRAKIVLFP
jgi:hypothetical protein